jgi:hypothetical protein
MLVDAIRKLLTRAPADPPPSSAAIEKMLEQLDEERAAAEARATEIAAGREERLLFASDADAAKADAEHAASLRTVERLAIARRRLETQLEQAKAAERAAERELVAEQRERLIDEARAVLEEYAAAADAIVSALGRLRDIDSAVERFDLQLHRFDGTKRVVSGIPGVTKRGATAVLFPTNRDPLYQEAVIPSVPGGGASWDRGGNVSSTWQQLPSSAPRASYSPPVPFTVDDPRERAAKHRISVPRSA